jgi:hypothetical protein
MQFQYSLLVLSTADTPGGASGTDMYHLQFSQRSSRPLRTFHQMRNQNFSLGRREEEGGG